MRAPLSVGLVLCCSCIAIPPATLDTDTTGSSQEASTTSAEASTTESSTATSDTSTSSTSMGTVGSTTDVASSSETGSSTGCGADVLSPGCAEPGTVVWYEVFEGVTSQRLSGIGVAGDGSIVLGGTGSAPATAEDAWIGRFDAQHSLQWELSYSTEDSDTLSGLTIDPSGNGVAVGTTTASGTTSGWAVAFLASGNYGVEALHPAAGSGGWLAVARHGDEWILGGYDDANETGVRGTRLHGYSDSFELLWSSASFESSLPGTGATVDAIAADGIGVYVAGAIDRDLGETTSGVGGAHPLEWSISIPTTEFETWMTAVAIAAPEAEESELWFAGGIAEADTWGGYLMVTGRDGLGATEFPTNYGRFGAGAYYRDVAVDAEGNVIVVGTALDGEFNGWVLVQKFDASGGPMWDLAFSDESFPFGSAEQVVLDDLGFIYVAGYASDGGLEQGLVLQIAP